MAALPGTKIALARAVARRWRRPTAGTETTLLIGAERDGLPADVVEQADHVAHIPIATDSLNAAMAATVALYELKARAN